MLLKSPMIVFNWRKNFPIWINVFLPNLLSYFFNRLNWKRISIWKCSDQEGYWNWVHFDLFSSLLVFCQKNRRVPQVHFVKFYKKNGNFIFPILMLQPLHLNWWFFIIHRQSLALLNHNDKKVWYFKLEMHVVSNIIISLY